MSYKIVMDSCGEFLEEWKEDARFESVPLVLTVGNEEIVDDSSFDQAEILKKVAQCPNCQSRHARLRSATDRLLTARQIMFMV